MWQKITRWPRVPFLWLIKIYQKLLSPDQSFWGKNLPLRTCRFQPTCSQYAYEAIDRYGLIKGGLMAAWRILRCNPWSKGGFDPVEKDFKER